MLAWTNILMVTASKGHTIMFSQQPTREQCLQGDPRGGPGLPPFGKSVEYDVMIWMNPDIIFKPEDLDALINSPHSVTSGLYMTEDLEHLSFAQSWDDDFFVENGRRRFATPADLVEGEKYIPVAHSKMGWMAVKNGVIESIQYPWISSRIQTTRNIVYNEGEEEAFCRLISEAGHTIYVDTSVRVGNQKLVIV